VRRRLDPTLRPALVLALAAWVLLKVVIGVIAGIAWFVVVVVAIIAVVWAARTLF
jgi:hypothetical protein